MIQDASAKDREIAAANIRLQNASVEEKLHAVQEAESNNRKKMDEQVRSIEYLNLEKTALNKQLNDALREQTKMTAEMDQLREEAKNGENVPDMIAQATSDKEKEINGLTEKIKEYENQLGEKDGVINTLREQQGQESDWKRKAQQEEDNLLKVKEELNQLRQLATVR